MKPNIEYIEGSEELLSSIEPLWLKLSQHHQSVTKDQGNRFISFPFQRRMDVLLYKARGESIRVDLAKDADSGQTIGYSLSSIVDTGIGKEGEIESLYIEPNYRSLSIGEKMMQNALDWMDGKGVTRKKVGVVYGNERAFKFYEKFGFYPGATILRQSQSETAESNVSKRNSYTVR